MPFQSKSQMKMMFAKDMPMAKRWTSETTDMKNLPEHKKAKRKAHMKLLAKVPK